MSVNHTDIRTHLLDLVEPVCEAAGYELVDIDYRREQGGWVLRVFIDRGGDEAEAIGFGDCERISRELSAFLDVEDPIPTAYSLEVSSPGIERPLRSPSHFRRYAGSHAAVVLRNGLEGRRKFKGTVEGYSDESGAILMRVENRLFSLPISDLRSAKLLANWDSLLEKGSSRKEHAG